MPGAGFYFQTDMFPIRAGEDKKTNPGFYGEKLGEWLCGRLSELGYQTRLVAETWGWCVVCSEQDCLLWVGCGIERDSSFDDSYDSFNPPACEDVVWVVFTCIEVPFFRLKSLVKKALGRLDLKTPLERLNKDLKMVLETEPRIDIKAPDVSFGSFKRREFYG